MYFSQLCLDMRPHARGQSLLRDVYALHQRLWQAFPDVDEPDGGSRPFMFRVETGRPTQILVQSACKPDWHRAFHHAPGYTNEVKVVSRDLEDIAWFETCRFRLLANPVRTKRTSDDPEDKRRLRQPISDAHELWNWLERQLHDVATVHPARANLFGLDPKSVTVPPKRILVGRKPGRPDEIQIVARLFEGTLTVHDRANLTEMIAKGVGRAKAFGCGLLSLARA